MPLALMTAVIAVGGVLVLVAVFKAMWRVAEPGQALLTMPEIDLHLRKSKRNREGTAH